MVLKSGRFVILGYQLGGFGYVLTTEEAGCDLLGLGFDLLVEHLPEVIIFIHN